MALVRHSFITATAANWVYTMDCEGFEIWVRKIALLPLTGNEATDCVQRIARQVVKHDFEATERQWSKLQSVFTSNRDLA